MAKVKDPVCGMHVDEEEASWKVEFNGEVYAFCSPGCKSAFEKDPERYTEREKTDNP
jgi:xanthine dehydrogenase accessory factor